MSKYGEPWSYVYDAFITSQHNDTAEFDTAAHAKRAVACVNALAGIDAPKTAIDTAREALTAVAAAHQGGSFENGRWVTFVTDKEMEAVRRALSLLTRKEQ